MMKFTLFFALIYQIAQIAQGFVTLNGINNLLWAPPGCVACYQVEGNNFFQNLNRLRPHCAEKEINEFNGVQSKIFLHHVCEYQSGTGFSDKYKALQKRGNVILEKFQKCFSKKLGSAEKRRLENATFEFENARKRCENEQFLEKGLKSLRQIYSDPSSSPPQNRKQIRKPKRSAAVDQSEIMEEPPAPVIENQTETTHVAPLVPLQDSEDELEDQSTSQSGDTSLVDQVKDEEIISDGVSTMAENTDPTPSKPPTEEQFENQSTSLTDDTSADPVKDEEVISDNDSTAAENAGSKPSEVSEDTLADQSASLTNDIPPDQTQDDGIIPDNASAPAENVDTYLAGDSGEKLEDQSASSTDNTSEAQVQDKEVTSENASVPEENVDPTSLENPVENVEDEFASLTDDTSVADQMKNKETMDNASTSTENVDPILSEPSTEQLEKQSALLNDDTLADQVENQEMILDNDSTLGENIDAIPSEKSDKILEDQSASLTPDTTDGQVLDKEMTTPGMNVDTTLEGSREKLEDQSAPPLDDVSEDQAQNEEATSDAASISTENVDLLYSENTTEKLDESESSIPVNEIPTDQAQDEEITAPSENVDTTLLNDSGDKLEEQSASPTENMLENQVQGEVISDNVSIPAENDDLKSLENLGATVIKEASTDQFQDEMTSDNASVSIGDADPTFSEDTKEKLDESSSTQDSNISVDQLENEEIISNRVSTPLEATEEKFEDQSASLSTETSANQLENTDITSNDVSTPINDDDPVISENPGEASDQSTNDVLIDPVNDVESTTDAAFTPTENIDATSLDGQSASPTNDISATQPQHEDVKSNDVSTSTKYDEPIISEHLGEASNQSTSDTLVDQANKVESTSDTAFTSTENVDATPFNDSGESIENQSAPQNTDVTADLVQDEEVISDDTSTSTKNADPAAGDLLQVEDELVSQDNSTLSTDDSSKQSGKTNVLVPLEETLIAAPVGNVETNSLQSPNGDESTSSSLPQIQNDEMSMNIPDTSSHDDFWTHKSLEITPESKCPSEDPSSVQKNDISENTVGLGPKDDDSQKEKPLDSSDKDELSSPSNTNISTENSAEMKSEEETRAADSSAEDLNTIQEDSLVTEDNLSQSSPEVKTEDESVAPSTDPPSGKLIQEYSTNDNPPENLPETEANTITPEIITESEPINNSSSEGQLGFENSETSTGNSIISPSNQSSLYPMNLVARISASKDDTTSSQNSGVELSSQNDELPNSMPTDSDSVSTEKNYEETHNDTASDSSNNDTLKNLSETSDVNSLPKDDLNDSSITHQSETMEYNSNDLQKTEPDETTSSLPPLGNSVEAEDESLESKESKESGKLDAVPEPELDDRQEGSSTNSLSDELKTQTSTTSSENYLPTLNSSSENQPNLQDDVSLNDKSTPNQVDPSATSPDKNPLNADSIKTNEAENVLQGQLNMKNQDEIEGKEGKLNNGYIIDHNTAEKFDSTNEIDNHLESEN